MILFEQFRMYTTRNNTHHWVMIQCLLTTTSILSPLMHTIVRHVRYSEQPAKHNTTNRNNPTITHGYGCALMNVLSRPETLYNAGGLVRTCDSK